MICEIEVPIYISVSKLKAYFTVNSSLSGVIQVLKKHRMSTAVDISAVRVKITRITEVNRAGTSHSIDLCVSCITRVIGKPQHSQVVESLNQT